MDSHATDNFCQIKFFAGLVPKSTKTCLAGVLKWIQMDFKNENFKTGWFAPGCGTSY